jgi:hypothetical protein
MGRTRAAKDVRLSLRNDSGVYDEFVLPLAVSPAKCENGLRRVMIGQAFLSQFTRVDIANSCLVLHAGATHRPRRIPLATGDDPNIPRGTMFIGAMFRWPDGTRLVTCPSCRVTLPHAPGGCALCNGTPAANVPAQPMRAATELAVRAAERAHPGGLGDELRCPVCMEDYSEAIPPFVIDCGHSFCEKCLNSAKRPSQGASFTIPCPICRRPSSQLRKNFGLLAAAEVMQAWQSELRVEEKCDADIRRTKEVEAQRLHEAELNAQVKRERQRVEAERLATAAAERDMEEKHRARVSVWLLPTALSHWNDRRTEETPSIRHVALCCNDGMMIITEVTGN